MALTAEGSRSDYGEWPEDTLYRPAGSARKQASLRLIPYFLWNNRGVGEMLVWMNAR